MAESNFDPFASSSAGAQGIAQFIPATAASYGLDDPFDPVAAIEAQAHLMSDLIRQLGSPQLALAAYNAGPAPVEACGCVPSIPETRPTSAASSPCSAVPGHWCCRGSKSGWWRRLARRWQPLRSRASRE